MSVGNDTQIIFHKNDLSGQRIILQYFQKSVDQTSKNILKVYRIVAH